MRQTTLKPTLRISHRSEFGDQTRLLQENAQTCMQLAERAPDGNTFVRYKQLEAAWIALAETNDWLDGKIPPLA